MTDEASSGVYRERINRTEKGEGGGRERGIRARRYTHKFLEMFLVLFNLSPETLHFIALKFSKSFAKDS